VANIPADLAREVGDGREDAVWEGVGTFLLKGDKIKEWRGYNIRVGH
jgi:hypothetical protein